MSENLNLKTISTIDPSPFKHLCVTIGELPSSFLESMSYYELLAWFVNYLQNTVIPAVNANGEATAELQELFVELKTFVDTYFENLDVQEEINNKLDQMAEDGTLQEIITAYIQANVAWTFDSVADMKSATNLVDGSYAQTVGYYNVNDGGGALYYITDTASVSDYQETLSDGLYATLVKTTETNILCYGAIKTDDSAETKTKNVAAINAMITNQSILRIPQGVFNIGSSITLPNCDVKCEGRINYSGTDYGFIIHNGDSKNFFVHYFYSPSGGFLKLNPTNSNEGFIYCDYEVDYVQTEKECVLMDGTYGSISLCNFRGGRMRSSNAPTVKMTINSGDHTYINENNFIGLDLKSANNKAVYADATGTGTAIQYKLERCDLENSTGIYSKDNASNVTLLNCRLDEISLRDNWITIENKLPYITILGAGIFYPKKIQLINVASNNNFLYTNMDVQVNDDGYYYHGAVINKNFISRLDYSYNMNKSITADDLTDDHYYTLPSGYNNNTYNYFTLNVSAWVQITVPFIQPYYEFTFRVVNAVNVTFKGTNADLIFGPMTAGYYKIYYLYGRLFYTKLNES